MSIERAALEAEVKHLREQLAERDKEIERLAECLRRSTLGRLLEGISVNAETQCWEWTKCLTKAGYGQLSVNKKVKFVHRLSWELHKGDIPEGMFVCHRCDNPKCCNPEHLFIGTHSENMEDMRRKGRAGDCRNFGEKHGCAKITQAQADEIKRSFSAKEMDKTQLSATYSISIRTINSILSGKSWNHGAQNV